jgi:WD40 repeat protein
MLAGCIDPHHPESLSVAHGCNVLGWDLRTPQSASFKIDGAHKYMVRDVDYNPNRPQNLATCGDDRLIKFWDLRSLSTPVKILAGHSHFVYSVKYNKFHDQVGPNPLAVDKKLTTRCLF